MLRRSVGAALVLFVLGGFVLAETYRGLITKMTDKEVTIKVAKKGEKPKEMTFKVSKDTKIQKAGKKGSEPETLTVSDLQKLIKKGFKPKGKDETIEGVRGRIETEGEGDSATVKTITVGGRGKGGKKGKKTDE
jgi:hypothetical protein